MSKYFSTYFQYLEEQDKKTRLAIGLSVFCLILLLVMGLTLPMKGLVGKYFRKDLSQAANLITCDTLPDTTGSNNDSASLVTQLQQTDQDLRSQLGQYENMPTDQQINYTSQIKALAEKRKQLILAALPTNASDVYTLLDTDDEANLAALTQNCAGTDADIEGTVTVWVSDSAEQDQGVKYYVSTNNGTIELNPANGIPSQLTSGAKIRIQGYRIDNHVIFDSEDPEEFTLTGTTVASEVNPALGDQKTIVIMFTVPNKPPLTASPDTIRNAIFVKANSFFRENSYGKTSFSGDVFGPYTVTDFGTPPTCYPTSDVITTDYAEYKAMEKAHDDGANFTKYGRIVFVGYTDCSLPDGSSTVGQKEIITPDGLVSMSVTKVRDNPNPSTYEGYSHELGHALGLAHAATYNCNKVSLVPTNKTCSFNEYGDIYDRMGSDNRHFNAIHKSILGWFGPSQILAATNSGTFTLTPIESASPGLKMIKVPRTLDGGTIDNYLSIEYRQPIGYDAGFDPSQYTIYNGALLHFADLTYKIYQENDTYLLDATPPFNVNTPTLPLNKTFTDPQTGTKITVVGITPSSLSVNIAYKEPTSVSYKHRRRKRHRRH